MAREKAIGLIGTPDVERLLLRAANAFRPSAPITSKGLFAGRSQEIRTVINGVLEPGRHVVVYGDRGVGKTSLAYVLKPTLTGLGSDRPFARINCDSADDFTSVWRKAIEELAPDGRLPSLKIDQADAEAAIARLQDVQAIRPDTIRRLLERLPDVLFVFDEFDRLSLDTAAIFADLIKMLSDYVVPSTVVIVGVGGTVEELVINHASIERALVQVRMPRMDEAELTEILELASASIGVAFSERVRDQIVRLSQGLPHYVHLLGLHSVRAAIQKGRLAVIEDDLRVAYREATENASHTLRAEYDLATGSARRDALFEYVLLACALAEKDEVWFRAAQVRKPLQEITNRPIPIDIPQFASHLRSFCSEERGSALVIEGRPKNFRYKFRNPLLEPYVIVRGLAEGLVQWI